MSKMIEEVKNDDLRLNSFLCDNNIDKPISSPFSYGIIYIDKGRIIGFLNYSIMYEKAEINMIYVLEEFRNRGIGSKMLDYTLKRCKICENITLEVRKDNVCAISLYKKFGFKEAALREKYYGSVDGVLMVKVGEK